MLRNIPFKKLVVLIILGIFAVGTFVGTRWYLNPQMVELENNIRKSSTQIVTLQSEIEDIKEDLALFNERKNDYDKLNAAGFFRDQSGTLVQEALAESQRVSGIIGGDFQINAPVCYLNKELAGSEKYVIIGRPMSLNVNSYDDLKIYEFIDIFRRKLPGYAVLQYVEITKEQEISHSVLQEIGYGDEVPLVSADLGFVWYTIVERDGVLCSSM